MSACLKSRTLRVTNLHWNERAVAAMIESKAAMDLPCFSACAVICAQASEDFGQTLGFDLRILLPTAPSHSVNADLRLDLWSLATPRCNSPQVIALIQSSWGLRALNHWITLASGVLLVISESTQVSSKYFIK